MFERDQVLECVSPVPGLIRGALYVCEGMVAPSALFPRWQTVAVKEAHTGKPAGDFWPWRFKAAAYELVSDRMGARP